MADAQQTNKRTLILTGASRGIGHATVKRFSSAGSRVHPYASSAYSTSKAALAALTREMAADFGPLGVRVNAIAPEEVASTIYFLCSPQASYVTGTEVHISGGQHV